MARVTVEDCVENLEGRFELVILAAQRARKIGTGSLPTIERDNDKNPVIALREIAGETIDTDQLKEDLIRSHQRIILSDEEDKNLIEIRDEDSNGEATVNEPAAGMYADENLDEVDEEISTTADEDGEVDALKALAGEVSDDA